MIFSHFYLGAASIVLGLGNLYTTQRCILHCQNLVKGNWILPDIWRAHAENLEVNYFFYFVFLFELFDTDSFSKPDFSWKLQY